MLGLQCTYYTFEFLAKGLQIKYDKDNNTTTQFIPFSQILTFRTDYIYDDKVSVITLMLRIQRYSMYIGGLTSTLSEYLSLGGLYGLDGVRAYAAHTEAEHESWF